MVFCGLQIVLEKKMARFQIPSMSSIIPAGHVTDNNLGFLGESGGKQVSRGFPLIHLLNE